MKRWLLLAIISVQTISAAQAQTPAQPKDYTAHVVGHSHIDMAWLWRFEESVHDVMYNTFRKQLELMDQNPDFTYAQDQAVVYEMMEHYYPDIFKGIAKRVSTHNWIPVSSTWTQMDENMPDGESLVRQFLYGQKYTKERFGHYVRIAWQPDVFGHPYSMPQIARKAGVEWYFFCNPQDPKRPPIFWWQGLDGTRVLGYTPPRCYEVPMDHDNVTVLTMRGAQRVGVKDMLLMFGHGDHGGGPNPSDLANIAKLRSSPNDVQVKFSNVEDFFDLVLAEKKDFPVVDGEQNPFSEGCYTSQVEMKRHNRVAEQLLLNAEKMSEATILFGYREFYPVRDISEAWKLVLLGQTHDYLPGSGIGAVYKDAERQYEEIFERGHRALDYSLQFIGSQVDTLGEGVPLVVYNPQSWDRADLVTAEISAPSLPQQLVATHGEETIPVQVLKPPTREGNDEHATIAFVAQKVPQMGLKLYRIIAAKHGGAVGQSSLRAGTRPRPYLENEFLRVEFDPATGKIVRLFDKQANREAFRGEGNFLVALEDPPPEKAAKACAEGCGSAWSINLTGKKWEVDKAASVELVEQGPARATLRVVHRFRDSEFIQDISLMPGVPRIDVQMSVDWQERSTLLKVGFPVSVSAAKVAAEIPYGAIEREQTGKEMVMGKWVDISDANYGVAVINNGRHGFDAENNVVRISVIRGPWYPDPRSDEGQHSFGYSIYPHSGGWREGKVEFQALAFNSPLIALQEPHHTSPQGLMTPVQYVEKKGGLPDSFSFVKTESDHVILYAMKQMEGFYDKDAILRFFECEGREGDVAIQFPFRVRATETNLLEDTLGPAGEGQTIRFHVKPWEIKTLRIVHM